MERSNTVDDALEAAAKVLIRCFALAMVAMLIWSPIVLFGADWVYSVHSKLFDITRPQFNVTMYAFVGLFKLVAFAGFLFPYLAIRWVRAGRAA